MDPISIYLGLAVAAIAAIFTAAIHSTSEHTYKHGIQVACHAAIGAMVGWLVGACGSGVIITLVTGGAKISEHLGDLSLMVSALAVAATTAWHYFGLVGGREDPERSRSALKHDGVYAGAMAIFVVAMSHGFESRTFVILKLVVLFIADDWAIISRYRIHHGIFDKLHTLRVSIATLVLVAASAYAVYWLVFDVNGPAHVGGTIPILIVGLYALIAPWTTMPDELGGSRWSPSVTNLGSITAFCLAISAFSATLSGFSAAREAPGWLEAEATILTRDCSMEYRDVEHMPIVDYYPAVTYSYAVGSQTHSSDTFSYHPDSYASRAECIAAIDAYLPKGTTTAWYSPENPEAAVLLKKPLGFWGGLHYLVAMAFALLMAILTIVVPAWGAAES